MLGLYVMKHFSLSSMHFLVGALSLGWNSRLFPPRPTGGRDVDVGNFLVPRRQHSTRAIPSYTWADCRYLHQTACQDEVQVLLSETWPGRECLPSWEGVLMIVASCDILYNTFSSVTKLSRSVREPNVGYAHVMGGVE